MCLGVVLTGLAFEKGPVTGNILLKEENSKC